MEKLLTDAGERNCITQAYPDFKSSNPNSGLKRKEENVFTPQQNKICQKQKVSNESERNVHKIRNNLTKPTYRPTNAGVLPSKSKSSNGNNKPDYLANNLQLSAKQSNKDTKSNTTDDAPKPYINQPKPQGDPKMAPLVLVQFQSHQQLQHQHQHLREQLSPINLLMLEKCT